MPIGISIADFFIKSKKSIGEVRCYLETQYTCLKM